METMETVLGPREDSISIDFSITSSMSSDWDGIESQFEFTEYEGDASDSDFDIPACEAEMEEHWVQLDPEDFEFAGWPRGEKVDGGEGEWGVEHMGGE
jgi:hypothetical protein